MIVGAPLVTDNPTTAFLDSPAPEPVMESEYVPRGVVVPQFEVRTVRMAELPVVGFGLNEAVAPAGRPVTENVMLSGKLDRLMLTV